MRSLTTGLLGVVVGSGFMLGTTLWMNATPAGQYSPAEYRLRTEAELDRYQIEYVQLEKTFEECAQHREDAWAALERYPALKDPYDHLVTQEIRALY